MLSSWLLAAALVTAQSEPAPGRVAPSRPDPEGVPTRVSLGFLFIDVTSINDLEQEFTADVFFRMTWEDPRLAQADGAAERVVPISEVWHPQPGALNRREISFSLPNVVKVDADGQVTYSQRAFGTFAARMDLRRFPVDTQSLDVQMVSYRYGPEEVAFEITPVSGLMEEPSVAGWRLEAGDPVVEPLEIRGVGQQFAAASFELRAEREVGYYILTMAMPLLLIALMAWAVFWIDPALLPPQVGISTAAVFSLIAYRFSLKLSLPRISYLTTADWFVLAITILVFSAFGHVILVSWLARTERLEQAKNLDRLGRWTYPVVLLGMVVLVVI